MPSREVLDEPVGKYVLRVLVIMDGDEVVSEAAKAMREKGVESVIVEEDGKPVGIITVRDLLNKVLAEGRDPTKTKLKEIASKPLITVEPKTKIGEAIALMIKHDIRRLPVMDAGKLIGVLAMKTVIGDIVKRAIPLPEVESPEGFTCPYCGSKFATREELSKHIDRVHIGAGILEGVAKW